MTYHASANRRDVSGWAQFHRRVSERVELQRQVKEFSQRLSNLIPSDSEWDAFWAPIPEGASLDELISILQDELARRSGHGDAQ